MKLSKAQWQVLELLREGDEVEVSFNSFDHWARIDGKRVPIRTVEALINRGLLRRVHPTEAFPRTHSYVISYAGWEALDAEHE